MSGFVTDPDQLHRAGDRLHDLVEVFTGTACLRYSAKPEEAGDPVLVAALGRFQRASSASTALLVKDAKRLGELLHEAAHRYAQYEENAKQFVADSASGPDLVLPVSAPAHEETSVIRTVLG